MKKLKIEKSLMIAIIALALAVLFVSVAFIVNFTCPKFDCENINDSTPLIRALSSNSSTRKSGEYKLTENIELKIEDVPENLDFYGTLNGQGHQITIKSDEASGILDRPIFNTIHKSAVIEQLKIVVEGVKLSAEGKKNISLLAAVNNGTIKNCSIEIGTMEIGSCPNTAAIVNFNCGSIFNVCLTLDRVESGINNSSSWLSRFGAVATVNYSGIQNILLNVVFDDGLFVFQKQNLNEMVGYVAGGFAEGGSIENIYLFGQCDDNFKYLARACDTYEAGKLKYEKKLYKDLVKDLQEDIQNKFNGTDNGKGNDFNNFWTWNNQTEKFPVLR